MKVTVGLDGAGYIPDAYAKFSDAAGCYAQTPVRSFPIRLDDVPEDARSLALLFFDVDSIPVCGFPWIHWCAAGIAPDVREIPGDASRTGAVSMVQGRNSSASRLVGSTDAELTCRYNGPQPPDKDHVYTLCAFALDNDPDLEEGFWANELLHAMEGHVLARAVVQLPARAN